MYDVEIIQYIGLAGAKSEDLVYMLIMRPQLWGAGRGGGGGGAVVPGLVIPYPCNSWSRMIYLIPKSSKNVRPKSKRACRGRCLGGGT